MKKMKNLTRQTDIKQDGETVDARVLQTLNAEAKRISKTFVRFQMAEVARARAAAQGNAFREVSAATRARELGERFDNQYRELSSLESLHNVKWDCISGEYVPASARSAKGGGK